MKRTINNFPDDAVFDQVKTPVGVLKIVASDNGLHGVLWEQEKIADMPRAKNHKVIEDTKQQLNEYFAGQRKKFDLPLKPVGTEFQSEVWQELRKIPYGKTISYGEQAQKLGDKNKARAVGMANGRNPISIIVPCHRVIGSNGSLTGFGGGLSHKQWLLDHEQNF